MKIILKRSDDMGISKGFTFYICVCCFINYAICLSLGNESLPHVRNPALILVVGLFSI